tara:strand:+ start:1399 stop:1683 length:285 start_codon:yes stop_codon:yes gene_type:complete
MALDHEAIYRAYPKAHSISEEGALDKDKNKINLVQSEIDAARTAINNELAATKYQRDRAAEYPPIADQLDDIYHNGIDGWKATIKATKDKYPKP